MNKELISTNQITEGIIWKQLLFFFFPIVFGTFFQQLYNTVDTMIVGHYVGKNALACVGGSAAQITSLIVSFFTGLSSGASVVISQFYGAKKAKESNQALHTAYAMSLIGSIIIGILGYVYTPSILKLMNTPEELLADTTLYLRIYFTSTLFIFIFNMGSAILQASGDSKHPLYYLIICCLVNIILDYVFVVHFHRGVEGVAAATWLAQAISAGLVTWRLCSQRDILHLSFRNIRIHGSIFKSQIRVGLPTGIQASLYAFSNALIMTAINSFGTDTVAAWSAYGKLDAIYWMVSGAFGIAITTFVGQNYGAGKYDRIHKSVRTCLIMHLLSSTGIILFLIFLRIPLFHLFTSDANVIRIGSDMLILITPFYIFYVFTEVFAGARKGMGDVLIPMLITLCGMCFLRIIWVFVCAKYYHHVNAYLMCYPVSWMLCAVAFIFYYFFKKSQ